MTQCEKGDQWSVSSWERYRHGNQWPVCMAECLQSTWYKWIHISFSRALCFLRDVIWYWSWWRWWWCWCQSLIWSISVYTVYAGVIGLGFQLCCVLDWSGRWYSRLEYEHSVSGEEGGKWVCREQVMGDQEINMINMTETSCYRETWANTLNQDYKQNKNSRIQKNIV